VLSAARIATIRQELADAAPAAAAAPP